MKELSIDCIWVNDRKITVYRNSENKIEGYYMERGSLARIVTPHEDEKAAWDYIKESFKKKRSPKMKIPLIPLEFEEDNKKHHTGE